MKFLILFAEHFYLKNELLNEHQYTNELISNFNNLRPKEINKRNEISICVEE